MMTKASGTFRVLGISGLAVCALLATASYAQQADLDCGCESVLKDSKLIGATEITKRRLKIEAASFCEQYSETKNEGKTMRFEGAYALLSASMGSERSSAKSVARNYCNEESDQSVSDDAYMHYLEEISPLAFKAYDSCLKLCGNDDGNSIRFKVQAMMENHFGVTVFYRGDLDRKNAGTAKILFEVYPGVSDDVSCQWANTDDATGTVTLRHQEGILLKCRRDDSSVETKVSILRSDADQSMTFSWSAYSEGRPVPEIWALEKDVESLKSSLERYQSDLKELQSALSLHELVVRVVDSQTSGWQTLEFHQSIDRIEGVVGSWSASCGSDQHPRVGPKGMVDPTGRTLRPLQPTSIPLASLAISTSPNPPTGDIRKDQLYNGPRNFSPTGRLFAKIMDDKVEDNCGSLLILFRKSKDSK